jgi:hypothetical protein
MIPVRFLAEGSPKREELLREIDSIKALYRNLKVKGVNRKEG